MKEISLIEEGSLFLRYKELKLQQIEKEKEKENEEQKKEDKKKEEENNQKIMKTEQNENVKIDIKENKETPIQSPKIDKSTGKGAFSKFLFLGGKNNIEKPDNNDDNDNNFDGRKIFRYSSLKCPKNSKLEKE